MAELKCFLENLSANNRYSFRLIFAGAIAADYEGVVNMDGSITFVHDSAGSYGGECLPA